MHSWHHSHSRSRYLHVSAIVTFYRYALTDFSCFKLSSRCGVSLHQTLPGYSIPTPRPSPFPVLVLYSILYSSSNLFKRYQPNFHSSTYTPLLQSSLPVLVADLEFIGKSKPGHSKPAIPPLALCSKPSYGTVQYWIRPQEAGDGSFLPPAAASAPLSPQPQHK